VKIPPRERDQHLAEKLQDEWPAILRWMLDGCLAWQRNGLMVPNVVRQATDEYFSDQDVMSQFINDWVVSDHANTFTTTAALFTAWKAWCADTNNYVGTEKAFVQDFEEACRDWPGFNRDRKEKRRGFNAIALKSHRGAP
jgi:putative DNA primase/helicase